jgi:hypothetical protein
VKEISITLLSQSISELRWHVRNQPAEVQNPWPHIIQSHFNSLNMKTALRSVKQITVGDGNGGSPLRIKMRLLTLFHFFLSAAAYRSQSPASVSIAIRGCPMRQNCRSWQHSRLHTSFALWTRTRTGELVRQEVRRLARRCAVQMKNGPKVKLTENGLSVHRERFKL